MVLSLREHGAAPERPDWNLIPNPRVAARGPGYGVKLPERHEG